MQTKLVRTHAEALNTGLGDAVPDPCRRAGGCGKAGVDRPGGPMDSGEHEIVRNVERISAPRRETDFGGDGIGCGVIATHSSGPETQFAGPGIGSAAHGIVSGRPDAGSHRVRTRAVGRGSQCGRTEIRLVGHGTDSGTPRIGSGEAGVHAGQSGTGSSRKEIHISHSRGGQHEPRRT